MTTLGVNLEEVMMDIQNIPEMVDLVLEGRHPLLNQEMKNQGRNIIFSHQICPGTTDEERPPSLKTLAVPSPQLSSEIQLRP